MSPITTLVTDADHVTGLGAARALRAAGAEVIGFASEPNAWTCRSRAWKNVRPAQEADAGSLVDQVLSAGAAIEGPVFLMPTADDHVVALARARHEFPENVRMAAPPPDVVDLLMEKVRFVEWAQSQGYPLPATKVVKSREELEQALDRVRLPALLKPNLRTSGWQQLSPLWKNIRLEHVRDLERIPFDLFAAAPSYVLSEWIDGADDDVLFCLVYLNDESEILASFTGRKLLQYPQLVGSTAVCTDITDPALEELTADLLRSARCRGLASLEVKRSVPDGRYLITEPTVGRPNLQSAIAVAAGINLHAIAMHHTWDRDWSNLVGRRKRIVWVEELAVFDVLTTTSRSSIPYRLIAREILAARHVRSARFRLSDIRPFASMIKSWIRREAR